MDGSQPVTAPGDRGFLEALLGLIEGILGRHVSQGGRRVDYAGIASDPEFLTYRARENGLAGFDPLVLDGRDQRLQFWVNVFNMAVVCRIIREGVSGSVDDSRGFFTGEALRIGGRGYCLDDIEFGVIGGNARRRRRPWRQFKPRDRRLGLAMRPFDPRASLMLVRGHVSDPPLCFYRREAMEAELCAAATRFIKSAAIIDREAGMLTISRYFRQNSSDFGGDQGVMRFIANNIESSDDAAWLRVHAGSIRVRQGPFDRGLNGPAPEVAIL